MDVCTHIVSDRLYLIDNLLCLLSNAVKYSDRGATIEVIIEITAEETIMNPTVTPVINPINAAGAVDSGIQLYVEGEQEAPRNHSYPPMGRTGSSVFLKPGSFREVLISSPNGPKGREDISGSSKPGSLRGVLISSPTSPQERKVSPDLSKPGSLDGSLEIHSKAKTCSQEIQAVFGISGIPNPNPDRLKKEMSARLLLDEPLPYTVKPAMLVVRVVDSGIGLSGIT